MQSHPDRKTDVHSEKRSPRASLILGALVSVFLSSAALAENIVGKVVDASSGSSIVGALIHIAETGDSTSTDRLGEFRFVGVAAGTYTLQTSVLGTSGATTPITVTAGADATTIITIGGGQSDGIEEVVVYGTRGAASAALNQQRAADNISNVVSGDLLGNFPDNTVAEGLRRLPGITFQRQERTGDGQFISIRGLDSGLNNMKINGINSAQSGGDRRVSLDEVSADAVSRVVVNKTLLPNHDGEGIGGSVELETVTALELNRRKISVSAEGARNDFREKMGGKYSATFSDVFGANENFGFLVSATSNERYLRSYEWDVPGVGFYPTVLPAGFTDSSEIPTNEPFPFEAENDTLAPSENRWSRFDTKRETDSYTIAFDWRPTDNTILSLIGASTTAKTDLFRQNFGVNQSSDSRYQQDLVTGRYVHSPRRPEFLMRGEILQEESTNNAWTLKGSTLRDRWTFDYKLGLADGETITPENRVEFEARRIDLTGFTSAVTPGGDGYVEYTEGLFPEPILTPAGYAGITEAALYEFNRGRVREFFSDDKRTSGQFDVTFEPDGGAFQYLKAGIKLERSDRRSSSVEYHDYRPTDAIFTFDQSPFIGAGTWNFDQINGASTFSNMRNILSFSEAGLRDMTALYAQLQGMIDPISGDPMILDQNLDGNGNNVPVVSGLNDKLREDIFATYFMGRLDIGQLEVIAGVRVEYTDLTVQSTSEVNADPGSFEGAAAISGASYTDVLPRLQLNYRVTDDLVFRGALTTALARPEPSRLSGTIEADYDRANNELLVSLGNANLKRATSLGLDFGVEYYTGDLGLIGANIFYKDIDDFIYADLGVSGNADNLSGDVDVSTLPGMDTILPNNPNITYNQPRNGESAEVFGIELTFARQFTDLPGFWSGFGIYSNAVFQDTEAKIEVANVDGDLGGLRTSRFFNAPDYGGTVSLTYQKYNFDIAMTYSFQGDQIDEPEEFFTDEHEQSYDSLDLNIKYDLPDNSFGSFTLFLRSTDIMDSGDKPINHETRMGNRRFTDDIEFDGRTIRFGFIGTFE